MHNLKHFVIWDSTKAGRVVQFRTCHMDMQRLVNKIIKGPFYIPGSLTVIVGVEELLPETGQELL